MNQKAILRTALKNNWNTGAIYALVAEFAFFGIQHLVMICFKVMSVSFLVCLPFIVGALTVFFSKE
jgi:hypothetical protein